MARPRKPTHLMVIQNTARPDRLAKQGRSEPSVEQALTRPPPPPSELDPDGRELWAEQAAILCARKVLARSDLRALTMWAQAHALLRKAERDIAENGMTVSGPRGGVYPNPALSIRKTAANECRSWVDHFGSSPAARNRVGKLAYQGELFGASDPWAKFDGHGRDPE